MPMSRPRVWRCGLFATAISVGACAGNQGDGVKGEQQSSDSGVLDSDSGPGPGSDSGSGPVDADGDGFFEDDCDDADAEVHPGAFERCNEVDDDCDGLVDEGDGSYIDGDGDGFGGRLMTTCDAPEEHVTSAAGGDCDDEDPAIYPGAEDPECDQVDQDCDGLGTEAARFEDGVAFDTIQRALDAAGPAEIITICTGEHAEHLIAAYGAELELRSFDGDPTSTYIDGRASGRILELQGGTATIRNLGFRNGYVKRVDDSSDESEDGGAIYARDENLTLIGSRFENNEADYGGAIGWSSRDSESHPVERTVVVEGSSFDSNSAHDRGGDISIGGLTYGIVWISLTSNMFSLSYSERQGGAISVGGGIVFDMSVRDNVFEAASSGRGGGCMYIEALLLDYPIEFGFGPVVITDSAFRGCSADGDGGAVRVVTGNPEVYPYPFLVDLENVEFTENESTGHGAALQLEGDGPIEAIITDVIFDQQVSGGGGSAIASIDEVPTTIRCERCTITGSQAGFEGGAVDIDDFATFESIDSDWGSLSTDNDPNDLVIPDYLYRNLKEHETFTCSPGAGCTIVLP